MKIVIVDDEPKIRNGLSKLLSSRPGFEITGVFENAMEALEQLSVSYADVIITDIKMPEINGLDLINRIREKDENTKIIILSGYSDFSFAQRAIELGVTRYLTKPTNARELIGILEEIEKNIQKPRSEEKQEMKVLIIGHGKVGSAIAENLAQDNNDVTVIENRSEVKCDHKGNSGSHPGTYPQVTSKLVSTENMCCARKTVYIVIICISK